MDNNGKKEVIHGYEVKRAMVFENNRGFALAENPNAAEKYVTWQFTQSDSGRREYYWGHYTQDGEAAARDYFSRIADYQKYGVPEKDIYKYYAAQHPIDIGTIPKDPPIRIVNFDSRGPVEQGRFYAWGYVVYDMPLTEKQIADYELRAAPDNPDVKRRMYKQAQAVGAWEEKRKMPEFKRFTWWYPDFGSFVTKEFVTPEQMDERYRGVAESRDGRKKPIAEQIKEGAEQAAKDNAARPGPTKGKDRGDR